MPLSHNLWLEVALALQKTLQDNLPDLIIEVNAAKRPDVPIVAPTGNTVQLGINSDLVNKKRIELPNCAVGVYQRIPVPDEDLETDDLNSVIRYPFVLEAYLAHLSHETLMIHAIKWATLFDTFARQYVVEVGDEAGTMLMVPSPPNGDVTMLLHKSDGFRQLVTVRGNLITAE